MSRLSGRLSIIDSFKTYAILTSEGNDRGFFVDLREENDIKAYPLGFDAPEIESIQATARSGIPTNIPSELRSADQTLTQGEYSFYHYRWTFVSLNDPKNDPWYGMESNPTPNTDVASELQRGLVHVTAPNRVAVVLITFQKPELATHIRIYRSNNFANVADFYFTEPPNPILDNLTYRLIGEVDITEYPRGGSQSFAYYDGLSDEIWTEEMIMREDNDRLPPEAKQIFYYNGLVFGAAGDRLVYSDLRNGNLTPWAFPADNEHRVDGVVDFCAEIREVLVFGGEDGLHRLTGGTEYDFRIGQIGEIGAIDGFSWGRTTNELAFVGSDGLYMTDGVELIKISDNVLDGFFENHKILTGAVGFQRDGDILFSLALPYGQTMQFKYEDKYWVRWDLPLYQFSLIDNRLFFVDATAELKELHWNDTEAENAETQWLFESHIIDLGGKLANTKKRFSKLEFTGDAENPMTLEIFTDFDAEGETPTDTKVFNSRDSLIPVKVPINKRGRRLKFRIRGTGAVILQGLKLEIMT